MSGEYVQWNMSRGNVRIPIHLLRPRLKAGALRNDAICLSVCSSFASAA